MSSGAAPRFREYKLKSTVHPIQHNVMIMPEKGFSFAELVPPVKLARQRIDHNVPASPSAPQFSTNLPAVSLLSVGEGKTGSKSLVSPAVPSPKLDAHGEVVSIAPYGSGSANQARKPFKRKTQVFMHEFTKEDDDARKLRIEESKPWVLEDRDNRAWQGRLEGGQQQRYVLFVNQGNEFRVIMVNKWYHFTSKIHYQTLSLEEAEKQMAMKKRDNESDRWMMKDKKKSLAGDNAGASEPVKKTSKIGTLRAQLKSDYLGADGDDDPFHFDGGAAKRKQKKDELEFEGMDEEIDFEEVFDDDEASELRGDDDERMHALKYKKPTAGMDNDDGESRSSVLNSAGKALKKTLRHLDKGNLYESDEELDPYAGSDHQDGSSSTSLSQEEEEDEASQGGRKTVPSKRSMSHSQPSSSQESPLFSSSLSSPKGLASPRASQPKPVSQSAAKIPKPFAATVGAPTPKKIKVNPPAAQSGISPPSSPALGSSGTPSPVLSRSSSPPSIGSSTDLAASSDIPAHLLLTEQDIIAHLRGRPIRTKDLITLIKPKLKLHSGNKDRFRLLVKKLATVKSGPTEDDRLLELRDEYK